ncbi:S-adenosyl-L-methionine:benzoic acid/salicylic acid carboxyl methyltransferase 1-like [Humulus lupulus]|uniref:S-adenosyl-L-methionine:benzoic acid/salicylic acid carboxyl methyltransferase 1-like n=1 Tax=Humulus lupulus TaxID=3486 RepID=UPI002B40D9C6|nr:S-adenosyl-L-methionine:benzoic acid/salicylic acid carboxyl methyltransferase 1-like [Humulus lupulus]
MEEGQVFPMNSGAGKASYANNSLLQKTVISKVRATVEDSALEVYFKTSPESMRIADLGCSSGPTALSVASYILDAILFQLKQMNQKKPLTLQVFLNDLPGNDFNTVFQSLSSFYERLKKKKKNDPICFVMAVPGSFYGRLFPNNSMHFIHSSYSLHYLSKAPNGLVSETGVTHNKGNIYITKTSPDVVVKTYLRQFEEDFTVFLRCRSEEMVIGGCMVLTMMGSAISNDPKHMLEIVGRVLNDLVSQVCGTITHLFSFVIYFHINIAKIIFGIIEEKSVDNFNVPAYCPTEKEARKVIEEDGSFRLQKLEVFQLPWDAGFNESKGKNDINNKYDRGKYISDYIRAVLEPILMKQFGESLIIDDFFERFTQKIIESIANENWHYVNLVISLTKN